MRDTRHWRRLGDELWLYRLDATFRLTLEGLGLYLAPVQPDTVVDYRFCPTEAWLELGFEWNLNRGTVNISTWKWTCSVRWPQVIPSFCV